MRGAARILAAVLPAVAIACGGPTQSAPRGGADQGAEMPKMSEAAASYKRACDAGLERARTEVTTLEGFNAEPTLESVLRPLDDIWAIIDRGMNTASLYSAVHPDASLREVADVCEQEFRKIYTDISLSRPLFEAVRALHVGGDDPVTERYVRHLLRDFRRAGVDKDEPTRSKIRALKDELVKISQEFGKNIREDVRSMKIDPAQLAGLPQDYIDAHPAGSDGKVTITTDYPDYIPFVTYADSDAARLELYKEFRKRGHPANFGILQQLLAKRYELAQLLGYSNWAQFITEDKMIKSEKAAHEFIEKVRDVSRVRAKRDYDELLARLQKDLPGATAVGDWQKSWVEEKVKKEVYAFDSQKVRQYFNYDRTREGLFAMTSSMFGVEYRKVDLPTWHADVEAFEVVDGGEAIGRFYLDMHPRADKYKHAAAFPIVTGIEGRQLPEAALVCNFPAEGPMEHEQVETFFHEFGHLIHHIFAGKHRWVGVSGFNTEWDFVEAPSQMLEEWAWHPATLESFARNDAGEVLPRELIEAMRKARNFGKGLWVAHQLFYASVSLDYYDRNPDGFDTTERMKVLQAEYSPFDYVDDTYFQLSFGHLDGYSAMYYTYMWSLVIAKDLFSVFETKGLLDPATARSYRENVLAPGGSRDASDMVHDFLQRDYTFEAFANWLDG